MDEKRQKERKKTGVFFGVYNRDNAKYVGRLVDLTTNGLMLIGKTEIKVNDVCKLKMDLPEPINEKSQIVFDARCKWCGMSKKTNLFSVGFEFVKVEPADVNLIDDLVEHPLYNDTSCLSPILNIADLKD